MKKAAVISSCQNYRYTLSRIWDEAKPIIMFIGLNPSTADAENDDPTITRLINFTKSWGYGGFIMCNLFAFRATDPWQMFKAVDPVGTGNTDMILEASRGCEQIVFCWGINGFYKGRDKEVIKLFKAPLCFGQTFNGYPKHPLYLKADTQLQPFNKEA